MDDKSNADKHLSDLRKKIEEGNRVRQLLTHPGYIVLKASYEKLRVDAYLKLTNDNVKGVDLEKAQKRYNDLVVLCKLDEALMREGELSRELLERNVKEEKAEKRELGARAPKIPNLYNSNIRGDE